MTLIHTELPPDAVQGLRELAATSPSGCFVEVGVYKGGSAWHLAQVAFHQNRALHLFDTFSGMPFQDNGDLYPPGAFGDTSFEQVKALIPEAIYYRGVFPDALPPFPEEPTSIAFAHVDCDQYRSVRDCIVHLWPRMVGGGIMLFDDAPYIDAAQRAVSEYFKPEQIRPFHGRCYVVKS